MFRKKIRQTHNFNLYSLLWILAFAIFIYLMREWYITKNFVGVVESKSHLLSVGESGRLQSVLVTIGDEVKKDQVLALLDISDLKTTLNQL
ncbi:biotin/lipoyl-binding protein, partial [candidate division KSB1 bacterium]